jgi:phage shock protein E
VADGAALVDVRTPGEFAGGHADGAVNIPLDALGGRLAELDALLGGDRTKPLVVYCRTGRRSGIAQRLLTKRGYGDVVNAINQATLRGD